MLRAVSPRQLRDDRDLFVTLPSASKNSLMDRVFTLAEGRKSRRLSQRSRYETRFELSLTREKQISLFLTNPTI